jgi:signal transduction histidine kinase
MGTKASDRVTAERAALRRVAVLAAKGAPPEEMFAAVTAEMGRLLDASQAVITRYDADKTVTSVGRWNAARSEGWGDLYTTPLGGRNVSTLILETGRPARITYSQATGPLADLVRGFGGRSGAGVPINVEGRLWGAIIVTSEGREHLPADTEARLEGFTELLGTVIANAQARVELRARADEQAALRRVATLVAGGAPPAKVFAMVTEEIGRVMSADFADMKRYDADGTATAVGLWSRADTPSPYAVGDRWSLGGRNVSTLVHQTGKPARIENYDEGTGILAEFSRARGFRSAAGAPINVAGRLWGLVVVGSTRVASLPGDAEVRLAAFTELTRTAIANTEAQAALAASRARIVSAADEARRRIERDLHDGAQQRLVTLALQLRELQATASPMAGDLVEGLDGVVAGLDAALAELREIACGIHPTLLSDGGLGPAMAALARRCPIPVDLQVQVAGRIPGPIEVAAYYVACEALANAAKHAHATIARVVVAAGEGVLRVCVHDDGRGGATLGRGSGLIGLKDRVEAFGGRITLHSPTGAGTTLEVHIPLQAGRLPEATLTGRDENSAGS